RPHRDAEIRHARFAAIVRERRALACPLRLRAARHPDTCGRIELVNPEGLCDEAWNTISVPSPLVGEGGSREMPHAAVSTRQRNRAKRLRRAMTRAETLLCRHLKADRIDGLGFRRQVPFRNYIADFACLSIKLIVELDGESHDFEERQKADQNRDTFFESE